MTVTYPIVALAEGEVVDPQWILDITSSVNDLVAATPPVAAKDSAVTDGTTTSTSFTNSLTTTTTRGISFTAPISGNVMVNCMCSVRNGNAGGFTLVDFEVRQGSTIGSGTVIRAADENSCANFQSDSAGQQGSINVSSTLVSGLTAGVIYNAVMVYRVNVGTGTINRRKITVELK